MRVWNDSKASEWSAPQRFGVGILDQINGRYIGAAPRKSSLLRKKFNVPGDFSQALLYVNSLGYHEVYLNGQKVSDAVLTPAVSQLSKHSLIITYDVSNLLKVSENDLVLWTSAGWYRKHFDAVYDGALVCAELDIDGQTALTTDENWLGCESGYWDIGTWIHDDYTGECINAMRVPKTFIGEVLDTLQWMPVDTVSVSVKAVQQMCEPCTIQETFSAVSVKPYGENMWIADMGRVVNGLAEITLPQLPAGHETTVGFSDTRFDDGTVFTFLHNTFVSSGAEGGDTFADKFLQQAYQYLVFVNLPVAPKPEDVKVHRMRTDYSRRFHFSCSDPDLCTIHDMVAYTTENHQNFYYEDGTYGTGSQIDMSFPLLVGAVPDSLVQLVENNLIDRTAKLHDNHIACGLVGVPVLTEWATLSGKSDFIYKMLKQTNYPGYLYMKANGATAVWESWNGERSRLHNCYNGIGSWFYQALGGIIPTQPGYRRVAIQPQTPAGIDWVDVREETPYGTLKVYWERKDNRKVMKVSIPVGIMADILGKTYGNGDYSIEF